MTISLIITTYNRPDALKKVVESALCQTRSPEEIIIADDGSSSETINLVREMAASSSIPIYHCWQEDSGFRLAMIRNKAIAAARHPYIVMIDGDIVLDPNFIKSHSKAAQENFTVQGSRVLLSETATIDFLEGNISSLKWHMQGISNRMNTINNPLLSTLFSKIKNNLHSVRGCNMAFWRDDVIKVNGFNEAFQGWGREDSEFVARMLHSSVQRKTLKFGGVGYHLYHPESTRASLSVNDEILSETLHQKKTTCERGIDQYL